MAKEIVCAFGTDVDSVAGWLGSYGGGDFPSDIQRGIFASEVGIIRLLNLFKKYKLKTTFFIPGTPSRPSRTSVGRSSRQVMRLARTAILTRTRSQ